TQLHGGCPGEPCASKGITTPFQIYQAANDRIVMPEGQAKTCQYSDSCQGLVVVAGNEERATTYDPDEHAVPWRGPWQGDRAPIPRFLPGDKPMAAIYPQGNPEGRDTGSDP